MKRKVRIEIDGDAEEEIVIRCKAVTPEILRLQQLAETGVLPEAEQELALRLGDSEFFVPLSEILFFESNGGKTAAHTKLRMFETEQTLAALSAHLPSSFMRVSKSCILNLRAVRSLRRDLTGIGEAFFADCNKKVFVSRMYYSAFRDKIAELRLNF